jgi:predicted dehydrogenase
MKNDSKLRWGVLGCGRIAASAMIPAIQTSRNGEVFAVASRDIDRAKEYSRRFQVPRAYDNYNALLNDRDIDAVYIALPNHLHCPWTVSAAAAGKHVLCEKPAALNSAEALGMREACQKNGVLLMEAFAQRFHDQLREVTSILDQGLIGKVLRITATMSRSLYPVEDVRMNSEFGGGSLMDLGCYCINTARAILESEPIRASASQMIGRTGVDERTTATMFFPDGVVLQFDTNLQMAENHFEQGCTLYGERGSLHIPSAFSQVDLLRFGKVTSTTLTVTNSRIGTNNSKRIRIAPMNQYRSEVEFFADRVLSGRSLNFPAEDGVANMVAIDTVVRSAQEAAADRNVRDHDQPQA